MARLMRNGAEPAEGAAGSAGSGAAGGGGAVTVARPVPPALPAQHAAFAAGPGLRASAASRVGAKRSVNQDRWLVLPALGARPPLLAVADGVGGGAAGERASAAAVGALEAAWRAWAPDHEVEPDEVSERLLAAARRADGDVRRLREAGPAAAGAATTLTAAAPVGGRLVLVHAGDSRAYLARAGLAKQVSTDHTLANDPALRDRAGADAGGRPPRNVITRFLGQEGGCVFDVRVVPLEADHSIILCTDGVTNLLTPGELAGERGPRDLAWAAMEKVARRGGGDDATVVVCAPTGERVDPFGLRRALSGPRRRRRELALAGAGAAALAVVGGVAGCVVAAPRAAALVLAPFKSPPLGAAQAYLAAWAAGEHARLWDMLAAEAQRRTPREAFVKRHEAIAAEMTLTGVSAAPAPDLPGERPDPSRAEVPIDVVYATARFGELRRRTALPLVWERGAWRVDWRPTVILPELTEGRLVRAFSEPLLRGAILDHQRRPLATTGDSPASRTYPQGAVAGPLVGYTGQVTAEELKDAAREGYLAGDARGKAGVEAAAEALLVGQRGGRLTVIHPSGDVAATLAALPTRPGENVLLAVDLDLQRVAEEALGGRAGSVIVIDPADGGVRAMASSPRYDPNAFGRGEGVAALLADPAQPLLNRPAQGQYPAGSTFKAITMAAGLESGLFRPESEFTCTGRWTGLPGVTMACWNPAGHGRLSLVSGLTQSCNAVFYEVGKRLDEWNADFFPDFCRRCGVGAPTGALPRAEAAGVLPTPAWKREAAKEPWVRGDAVNLAIGQGRLLVTPLQMAALYGAVAAGGRLPGPRVLDRAALPGGNVDRPLPAAAGRQLPWSEGTLAAVRAGLRDVVGARHGTASFVFAGSPLAGVTAGKTGTAESAPGRPSHAWFACFAPFDAPRAVVLVMLEHGGEGSRDAAPVARRVLEAALGG